MASGTDQFFEDEESLTGKASASAASPRPAKKAHPSASTAPVQAGKKRPPSFLMVVVIALVAPRQGVARGVFKARHTWSSKLEADHAVTAAQTSASSDGTSSDGTSSDGTSTVNEEAGLPEGHPDLASLMNADGTLNEEKLAEYKAQLEAAQGSANGDE